MDSDSRRSGRLAQPLSSSSMACDDYMVQRVDDQLAWLGKKSQRNKSAFLFHRVVGIGLGALITILSPYAGQPGALKTWIPPLLQISGAGVAIAGSLLALYQYQENWVRYRTLKEALLREKMLYLTGSSQAYSGPDGFQQFVRTAEDIMALERSNWSQQASDKAESRRAAPEQAEPAAGLASNPRADGPPGPDLG
jgi:hypothetical protein